MDMTIRNLPTVGDAKDVSDSNVRAVVRVRPFNEKREPDYASIVAVDESETQIRVFDADRTTEKHSFNFDRVFWSVPKHQTEETTAFSTQEDVFHEIGTEAVDSIWQGLNVCVFAYGQTGSGKTHTMMGSKEDPGLIPRICKQLIEERDQRLENNRDLDDKVTFKVTMEARFYEIYNEKVQDLLVSLRPVTSPKRGLTAAASFRGRDGMLSSPKARAGAKPPGEDLKVRTHPIFGPFVEGSEPVIVDSPEDILNLLEVGNSERTTAATKMNDRSSRSHAIFRLRIIQSWTTRVPGKPKPEVSERVSTLNLVDLAGSERVKASGVSGTELQQATNINLSLTTLRRVIDALIEQNKNPSKKITVPYRDSVLTYLLSPNLGGNSKTTMVATISPHATQDYETLNTLNYAMRAKAIVNNVRVNEDSTAKVLADLQAKMQAMQAQQASLATEEERAEAEAKIESYKSAMEEVQVREQSLAKEVEEMREEVNEQKTKRILTLFQSKVRLAASSAKTTEEQEKYKKEIDELAAKLAEEQESNKVKEKSHSETLHREQSRAQLREEKDARKRAELMGQLSKAQKEIE
eukprot:PhM_4_TR10424/c2_g1_i1/m.71663/K17914/KIF13; kinesin family member 13